MSPAEPTALVRLRALLEDVAVIELDQAVADGEQTDFYVSNPPFQASPPPVVLVDNTLQVLNTHYVFVEDRGIKFLSVVAQDANVSIRYSRETWLDDELEGFLDEAAQDWSTSPAAVYQAAIYALDTLLLGAATALPFGAGAESFDMTTIFTRLQQLRTIYMLELSRQAARPVLLTPDSA